MKIINFEDSNFGVNGNDCNIALNTVVLRYIYQ